MRTLRDLASLGCITLNLGLTKSITLSVEEILVKKMDIMESYSNDLSDESDCEDDE